jgi:DNA repair exonuclease SbcCD nuclease subunit
MNLFRKAAVFGDIHIGQKSNSPVHLEDCFKYTEWFIEEAHKAGCDICLFLGDFFHNRNSINILTMNYGLRCLRLLSDAFDRVIMIPGNHDLYWKDSRETYSVSWAEHIPNIRIINEWEKVGDCIFVPWMVKDDNKRLFRSDAKYMFGHFELPNFFMNSMVKMPDVGEIEVGGFANIEHVFTGHFHKRQTQRNITYIGNAFPHNYADAWDDERGMMILEWGKEPEFKSFPDAPKYRTYALSDIVQNPEQLQAHTYAKVTLDVDISYEEANFIKENMVVDYKLRELSFVPMKTDGFEVDQDINLTFETVDQIVTQQINAITSDFYDTNTLLKIYQQLG